MEEQARTKHLELGQGEEEGRREIQFIAGRVYSRLVTPTGTKVPSPTAPDTRAVGEGLLVSVGFTNRD